MSTFRQDLTSVVTMRAAHRRQRRKRGAAERWMMTVAAAEDDRTPGGSTNERTTGDFKCKCVAAGCLVGVQARRVNDNVLALNFKFYLARDAQHGDRAVTWNADVFQLERVAWPAGDDGVERIGFLRVEGLFHGHAVFWLLADLLHQVVL